jgi:hypothetical protein
MAPCGSGWLPTNTITIAGCGFTMVQSLAMPEDRQRVSEPYGAIGYQYLPLLIKTDMTRRVVAFGERDWHEKPSKRHADIWASFRRAAQTARERISFEGDFPVAIPEVGRCSAMLDKDPSLLARLIPVSQVTTIPSSSIPAGDSRLMVENHHRRRQALSA